MTSRTSPAWMFSGPQAVLVCGVGGEHREGAGERVRCVLSVVAVPLQLGPAAATMTIKYDDPNNPTATVSLAVIGVGGKISVNPNFVDFGGQQVNTTSAMEMVAITEQRRPTCSPSSTSRSTIR